MHTGGCHTDQNISRFQIFSRDHLFFVTYTYRKSGKIILIFRHQSRMLCRLSTDQCCIRLLTSLCHTFHDGCDLLRIILSACNIIQEEQWLTACTCNIVHAHGNRINTDRIMLVHHHCKLYLGSTTVCS